MPATWKQYGVDANRRRRQGPVQPGRRDLRRRALPQGRRRRHRTCARRSSPTTTPTGTSTPCCMRAQRHRRPARPTSSARSPASPRAASPSRAKATYADDLAEKDAEPRSVAKGGNAAVVVEADRAPPRDQDLRQGAARPVIAVNDGKVVRDRRRASASAATSSSRTSTATRYTYGHLGKVAKTYPAPKAHDDRARPIASGARAAEAKDAAADRARVRHRADAQARRSAARRQGRARRRARPRAAGAPPRSACSPTRTRPNARRAGGAQQLFERTGTIDGGSTFKAYFTARLRPQPQGLRLKPLRKGSRVIGGTILGRIGKATETAGPAPAVRDPPGRPRRPAHRPEADPRRLEAARVDRDLPRRGQEPVLRPRRRRPVDRPDPADEQGGAGPARARRPADRDLRLRPRATSAPARSTAACWRRSSSSPPPACKPDGHLAASAATAT